MKKKIITIILLIPFLFCISVPKKIDYKNFETSLEIKNSLIPKSGKGVFTKINLEPGIVIGTYNGKFITESEYYDLVNKNLWQYVMWMKDCARPYLGKSVAIDGRNEGNVFTRINYAPIKFQNVKFVKLCEPPYVIIKTLRGIDKGEELYIDYGPDYDYDFMEDRDVKAFFKRKE